MKLKHTVFALALLVGPWWAYAQEANDPPQVGEPVGSKLYIDPSSSTLAHGKVSLIVEPLNHKGKVYLGDYQIKVVPYFFKNEKGTLILDAPDTTVHKLMKGTPVKFTGKAINTKHKPKSIVGKATPSANDRGTVTFSVATENGSMVFNTSYHFGM